MAPSVTNGALRTLITYEAPTPNGDSLKDNVVPSLDAGSKRRRLTERAPQVTAECRGGHLDCEHCPLTPRTVYLLGAELAWLADMANGDIDDVVAGRRSLAETVFAGLPEVALAWGWHHPGWLERYARAADRYEARLRGGHPATPQSLAEEVLLRGAFDGARLEPDPDGALPPAARVLPSLPGDYAWARAAERVGFRPDLHVLYDSMAGPLIGPGDPLHPISWFEVYGSR